MSQCYVCPRSCPRTDFCGPRSDEYKRLDRILTAYGTENDHNHVNIAFDQASNSIAPAETHYEQTERRTVTVTFHMNSLGPVNERDPFHIQFAASAAHEGSHVLEGLYDQFDPPGLCTKFFVSEKIAYENESFVDRAFNNYSLAGVWNPAWETVDQGHALYNAAIESAARASAQYDCRQRKGGC